MASEHARDSLERNLPAGSHHYRAFIGQPQKYDIGSAIQFNLLTFLGLREDHYLLDIGCGSLRAGRLFIPYLLPGHYFGIEPESWLIEEGIKNECGQHLIATKAPRFSYDNNFTCTEFGVKFDFILAHSIFSHASQAQIRRCISEVSKCMKSTSIFAASFVSGKNNYTGNKWVYPDTVSYTYDRMAELANEFDLVLEVTDWPDQGFQRWAVMTQAGNERTFQDLRMPASPQLECVLNFYRERLSQLEGDPCVKLYLEIRKNIGRIKRLIL